MSGASGKVRVLVIDDSALVRKVLSERLAADPAIEVVGTANDPKLAWPKILQLAPDVLTLDVEMPGMDGVTFLRKIMSERPMPVVMVSSLTQKGADVTLDALEAGAVDFVSKPTADVSGRLPELIAELAAKIKTACGARLGARRAASGPAAPPRRVPAFLGVATHRVIGIGASTGGTEAIRAILEAFPPDAPGTLVVQHMPPEFTRRFAERCDRSCAIHVKEAEHGERVMPGHAYLAPGGRHLRVARAGAELRVQLGDDAPVSRHRPSVDVLFHALAHEAGPAAIAALLTGMGADGAQGMLAMRQAGARTVAQDRETSLVYGMPKEAVLLGAAEKVLPLGEIAAALVGLSREGAGRHA